MSMDNNRRMYYNESMKLCSGVFRAAGKRSKS